MLPLSVIAEQLPAISAQLGIEQSTLESLLTATRPAATPVPAGPHFPGVMLSAGFTYMQAVYFSALDAGVVEQMRGGQTLVPASAAFETVDATGGAAVGAAGAVVAASVPGK